METLEARDLARETRDLASRFGLTPPFVSPAMATPPFVASSSDSQTLDAPPVLGRQLIRTTVSHFAGGPPVVCHAALYSGAVRRSGGGVGKRSDICE